MVSRVAVRIEIDHDDDRVACTGLIKRRLAEDQDLIVITALDHDVAQQLEARMPAPDLVEFGDVRRERAALCVGAGPVADPDLVLLRIEVLLAAGLDRYVLIQFVAGVHAPTRGSGGGQRCPDLEHRRAAVLQGGMQDVGGVTKKLGRIR